MIKNILKICFLCFISFSLFCCNSNTGTDNDSPSDNNSNTNTVIDDQTKTNDTYPILKISSTYSGYIYSVGLVGYSFNDLRIENNESKSFELINGIPGGNNNVNVNITFRPDAIHIDNQSPLSVKCNFQNGKTTTITIPGGAVSISD